MARVGISNGPREMPILYILKGLLSNYTTVEKNLLLRGALRVFLSICSYRRQVRRVPARKVDVKYQYYDGKVTDGKLKL